MLLDVRIYYLAVRREGAESRFFVLLHVAAIAMDVGAKYGRKPSLHSHFVEHRPAGRGRMAIRPTA
jgi:hypothetical protein